MKNLTQHQTNVDEILKHPKQSFIEKIMHAALQKKIAGAVFLTSLILKTKQVCAEEVVFGAVTAPLRNDFIIMGRIILNLGAFLLGVTLLGKLFKKMSFFWFLSFLTFLPAILLMLAVFDFISQEPETYFNCWHDEILGFISCGVTPTQTHIKYLPFFNGLSLIFCIIALLIWCIPFLSFIFYKFKKINLERFNNILNVWVKALICFSLVLTVPLIIKEKYFYALLCLIMGYLMLKKLPLQQKLIVVNTLLTGIALFSTRELSNLMNMGLAYLLLSIISVIPCIQSIKSLENQTEKKKKFAYSIQFILTTWWAIFVFFNFLISTLLNV
ncbi:MAG: hypothetical protein IJY92_06010 [Alphaproteobacteria bacterium]|nr:hypothetical protein [Alphaproteobacteria bacterium]